MSRRMRKIVLAMVILISANAAYADVSTIDAESSLAKKAQNPVENMISVPFNNNFNFNYGQDKQLQFVLNVKPVIPIELNDSWNIITRTIIPVQVQPTLPSGGYMTGLGDINPTFFLSPAHPGKIVWGIGPSIILPTATRQQMGQGKYSIGPALVVLTMPGHWVVGALTSTTWSVGGQSSRPGIEIFTLQYFINYNLPKGWYITSQPVISANRKPGSRYSWTVPFGAGAGRVFHIGDQALNTALEVYKNVKTPQYQSNLQVELSISLLFPKL
jgi:hypothetical protein